MKNRILLNSLFPTGAIFVFAASILFYFKIPQVEYLFATGAVALISYHGILAFIQDDKDKNVLRLYRMGFLASFFLAIASYFIFTQSNSWIVMVLIYAIITLYISFRIK
jgi:uncharacterized membrane protein